MEAAETIYESVNSLEDIKRFVSDQVEEGVHIDFKGVANFSDAESNRVYAEAMSGFSNSDGGVIVWGIDARKNSDGVDAACGFKPIDNIKRFLSDLISLQTRLIDSGNNGIKHKIIEEADGKGYAVTLVPYNQPEPIMAKGSKQHRYYRRSGDSFTHMEHWEVKTAFFREQSPVLEIYSEIGTPTINSRDDIWYLRSRLFVGIKNKGRGMARFASFGFCFISKHNTHHYGADGNGNPGFPRKVTGGTIPFWEIYAATVNDVIHPQSEQVIQAIEIIIRNTKPVDDINFKYRIVAEHFPLMEDSFLLTGFEIKNKMIALANEQNIIPKDVVF